mgnify:FL=1
MKRIKLIPLAVTMLLAAPAFLTSCQEDAPEINYTMSVSVTNDFTKVVEAIDRGSLKNEEAIAKLAAAIDRMNSDQQAKLQAIRDVLSSVNTTLETKLVAIEAALKAQTLSMEGKLDLIRGVLADQKATLDTRLAAIEAAMRAQTLSLEGKLDLLTAAVDNQTLKQEELAENLVTAIDNLGEGLGGKLDQIRGVLDDQNTTLKTKLEAIEAAVKAQTLSLEEKLGLLEDAVKALPDYSSQLEAISTAIDNLPDYGDKLSAIEAAVKGMPDYGEKLSAIVASLNAIKDQAEALGTGQTSIASKIAGVTDAINDLVAEVNSGNTSAAAALAQIIQKLEELKGSIGGGGTTPSPVEYVDLGLPSGLKWAKCNLGASKPSDYGDYYAWGETAPKKIYNWVTYKWMKAGQSDEKYITKYTIADGQTEAIWYDSARKFIGDNKTVLDAADDAATQQLGSPWRMPTKVDIKELKDNCIWTRIEQEGVSGYQVEGPNGNVIFLPAAGARKGSGLQSAGTYGNYWSSSLDTAYSYLARYLSFDSGAHDWVSYQYRYYGYSVRPVRP